MGENRGQIVAAIITGMATIAAATIGVIHFRSDSSSADSTSSPVPTTSTPPLATSSPVPAPVPAPMGEEATDVPAAYQGRWSGLASGAYVNYEITLSVDAGKVGSAVATGQIVAGPQLPGFGCTLVATLESGGSPLKLVFTPTSNPVSYCLPQAEVRLTSLSKSSIRYEVLQGCVFPGAQCSPSDQKGVLKRSG